MGPVPPNQTGEPGTPGLLGCWPLEPASELSSGDVKLLNSLLKVEYLLAHFYVSAAFSDDINTFVMDLSKLGAVPQNLTRFPDAPWVQKLMVEFTGHHIGQISALAQFLKDRAAVKPPMNIGRQVFANIMNAAVGESLVPEFNAFASGENALLTSFIISPLAPSLAMSIIPELEDKRAQMLVAGTLGALASEDAVIRTMLMTMGKRQVQPYKFTVGAISEKIAELRSLLDFLDGVECAEQRTKSFDLSRTGLDNMNLVDSIPRTPKRSPSAVENMLTELGILEAE